jgi:hypothetical protein
MRFLDNRQPLRKSPETQSRGTLVVGEPTPLREPHEAPGGDEQPVDFLVREGQGPAGRPAGTRGGGGPIGGVETPGSYLGMNLVWSWWMRRGSGSRSPAGSLRH